MHRVTTRLATAPPDRPKGRVDRIESCVLTVRDQAWAYADRNAAEIDAYWTQRASGQSGLFNGTVYMLADQSLDAGAFIGSMKPIAFKSFYYWRAQGFPDADLFDAFGSALIRSVEGHVLLGRQREGLLNAGLSYLPGGFIDPRDVDAGGAIDIAASALREALEETGLDASDLVRVPGFLLTRCAQQISFGVEFRSPLGSAALAEKMRHFLRRDTDAELSDIDIVRCTADLTALAMPLYADVLLRWLFAEAGA